MNQIILVGFMGSGKSTLGKSLSTHLHFHFIDTDSLIEEQTGLTVSEIFELKGEQAFRKMEKEAIASVSQNENHVIAVGGGLPEIPGMMQQLNELGRTVFLNVSEDELLRRLYSQSEKRPLIRSLDEQELGKFISAVYERRKPFYLQAKIVISSDNISVDDLLNALKEYE
jgi:shikimate kinase